MFQLFKTATILLGLLTILTGVVYPVVVTVIVHVVFPHAANGSLIKQQANVSGEAQTLACLGSELVGQPFSDSKYFWGRPSATAPMGYNGLGGSGSNQATTNPALVDAVRDRVAKLREADPGNQAKVPVDLVTASASGLDPHISQAAAVYQVSRVARARKIDRITVDKLVLSHVERATLGILGQSRVNVLKLNLALDSATWAAKKKEEDASKK